MNIDTIFTVKNEHLSQFDQKTSVEFFQKLLWAEARRLGVEISKITVSSGVSTEILRVKVAIRRSLLQNTPLCRRELRFPTTDTNRNFSVDRTLVVCPS